MEVTYQKFFETWCLICKKIEKNLLEKWDSRDSFTKIILKDENCITKQIAKKLGLEVFHEYYSHDAVFYTKSDIVKEYPPNNTWRTTGGCFLTHIKIAFEHENIITGKAGGYQEICHLLTTNSNLKILVGYIAEYKQKGCVEDFQSIIASQNDTNQSILLILGALNNNKITWNGYVLNHDNWEKMKP
jgi:hypothetical protein